VTTYTFRAAGGLVQVTADNELSAGGLSAWWVHADTADRLEELARFLQEWGTLANTLRTETKGAQEVLARVKK